MRANVQKLFRADEVDETVVTAVQAGDYDNLKRDLTVS